MARVTISLFLSAKGSERRVVETSRSAGGFECRKINLSMATEEEMIEVFGQVSSRDQAALLVNEAVMIHDENLTTLETETIK